MVPLFVPEETWGPHSWGVNHPLYVRGADRARPGRGEVRLLGLLAVQQPGRRLPRVRRRRARHGRPGGYTSDQERTLGRPAVTTAAVPATPAPTSYGDGVVTPHASFLAYRYAPEAALANLRQARGRTSTPTAPAASTTPSTSRSGQVAKRYLSLDQGMVMAALGNALAGDDMRAYVSKGAMEQKLRPLMRQEEFSGGVSTASDPDAAHAPTGRTGSGGAAATPSAATRRGSTRPTGLDAVAGRRTRSRSTWEPVPGAVGYQVYARARRRTAPWEPLDHAGRDVLAVPAPAVRRHDRRRRGSRGGTPSPSLSDVHVEGEPLRAGRGRRRRRRRPGR